MKKLKFRFILPLLLALVLALGSCMTVSATEAYPYPDDFESLGYDVIFKSNIPDYDYVILTSDAPCSFSDDCLYLFKGDKSRLCKCLDGVFVVDAVSEVLSSSRSVMGNINSYYTVVSSTYDIMYTYSPNKVFFRSPLARLAVPLKGEVLKQTKVILPVGVGCLALLIGSAVLLPRLRRSLLRL